MKQRKQRSRTHRHHQRWTHCQGNRQPQSQYGSGNPALQCRQVQSFKTQQPANQHSADKGTWQRPACGALLLCCPQADREHCQQVIETAKWVADTGDQAVVAVSRMGEGEGRSQQQGQGAENAFECHG
ncbi:hypothetical protein D9M69_686680 [compost metagenome]